MRSKKESHFYRWGATIVVFVVVLIISGKWITIPLRDSDKNDAAKGIIHWIVDDKTIMGFDESYPDVAHVTHIKRFVIVCDFLPANTLLSYDPRVQQITSGEYESVFDKYGYDDVAYVHIKMLSIAGKYITTECIITHGSMAGHCYTVTFRRTLWGLRAEGQLNWVM